MTTKLTNAPSLIRAKGRRRTVSTWLTMLSLGLACLADGGFAHAQDNPATPLDHEKAKYNAIVAKEKQLVAEITALEAEAAAIEKRLTEAPPAARDTRSAAEKAHAARVSRLSNEIRATLKERFKLSLDVVQLETEIKILRDIFDEITNGTTSMAVGLRFAEVTMRALAKGGVVKPRRTRFSTIYQLRNAIANARQALGTARAKETARKEALDRKLESLDQRLEALLHASVPSGASSDHTDADILAWLTVQQKVATKNQELRDVRDRLMGHHVAAILTARGSGPAHLQNVTLRTPHIVYYDAGWHRDGSGTQAAAANQVKLQKQIADQQLLIATIKQAWIELAAHRLPLAREMQRRANLLQTMASSYNDIASDRVISNAIIDGMVSVASIMVTGGTATLGAKLVSLQDDLTTRHAKSLASVADNAATRSLGFLGYPAHKTGLLRLQEAAKLPPGALEEAYVAMARDAARRQGRNVDEAVAQATKEIRYMIQRIHVDKRLREAALDLKKRVRLEKELGEGVFQTLNAAFADKTYQSLFRRGVFDTTSKTTAVAGVVVSDGFGLAAQLAMTNYSGRRINLPSVKTWPIQQSKIRKLRSLLSNNLATVVPTAVGTVTKSVVTAAYQDLLNKTITDYWTEYAQIVFLGRILKEHQAIDRGIHDVLVQARRDLARLQATYAALATPPTFKIATGGYLPDPEGQATLILTFSNGLTKAPVVKVGSQSVAMAPDGFAPDQPFLAWTFTGTLNFATIGDGHHVLDVALAPGTQPHARLDSDPTTVPAYYSPAVDKWRHVEDGPDRRHTIVMDLEVHRALRTLDALISQLREGMADFEERYGSGRRDYDGGWAGMSRSLEQAHTRIGAPVRGDPDGIAWLRFNSLDLKGGAAHRYFNSVSEFRDGVVGQLAWQMDKRMDNAHRAYLRLVEERIGLWHEATQAFHPLGDEWLETLATYTKIGALPDPAEIERLARANEQVLLAVEAEMKAHFPEPLPRFEDWKAVQTARD